MEITSAESTVLARFTWMKRLLGSTQKDQWSDISEVTKSKCSWNTLPPSKRFTEISSRLCLGLILLPPEWGYSLKMLIRESVIGDQHNSAVFSLTICKPAYPWLFTACSLLASSLQASPSVTSSTTTNKAQALAMAKYLWFHTKGFGSLHTNLLNHRYLAKPLTQGLRPNWSIGGMGLKKREL